MLNATPSCEQARMSQDTPCTFVEIHEYIRVFAKVRLKKNTFSKIVLKAIFAAVSYTHLTLPTILRV